MTKSITCNKNSSNCRYVSAFPFAQSRRSVKHATYVAKKFLVWIFIATNAGVVSDLKSTYSIPKLIIIIFENYFLLRVIECAKSKVLLVGNAFKIKFAKLAIYINPNSNKSINYLKSCVHFTIQIPAMYIDAYSIKLKCNIWCTYQVLGITIVILIWFLNM